MTVQHVAHALDLVYLLARHPQLTTTFVNGEAAALSPLVRSLAVYGMSHTGEPEPRPGGIPPGVKVGWAPPCWLPSFWSGNLSALRADPPRYRAELRQLLGTVGPGPRALGRAAYTFAQAAALSRRLVGMPRPHLHAHFAGRGAIGAHVVSTLLGTSYSMTVHAFDVFLPNPLLPLLVRGASLVVAISDYDRDEILRRVPGVQADRVRVIHVGVPARALGELGARADELRRGRAEPRIISVGNLLSKKGMDVLIDAVALLGRGRRVHLEIVGAGPLRGELEAQITRLGVADHVRLVGGLPPESTREAIAGADLFALASRRTPQGDMDGIPVVLMEAMAAGVPVVSTRLSGIPELVRHGQTGWLAEPDDAASLASVLEDALEADAARVSWARAGQVLVQEQFDQETNARQLLDAILSSRIPV